jgi:hypothetical protein
VESAHDAVMNLLCLMGRHRWVIKEGQSETGQAELYQQCDRCLHYPKTSRWSRGEGFEPPGGDTNAAGAPSGY